MTTTGRARIDDAVVAGGGLLSRRKIVGAGVTASASAIVTLGLTSESRAEPVIPQWAKQAGLPVRGYGLPDDQEADIQRALIQPHKDLAPEFSFSGTPLHRLRGTITPSGLHFEVHHGGRPLITDVSRHSLMIHGLVDRPLAFDLESLERYPMVSRVHFIECAGNGFFNALSPEPPDMALDMLQGLLSNSEWTGVPLSILMDEAGIQPDGKWVVAIGGDAPNLARSIPMQKVIEDGMLALYQNGERIRPEQGYPMRILVPGYEGNMNVKWVTSLWVTSEPPHTRDASGAYTDQLVDGSALKFSHTMGVKSLITHPSGMMSMSGPGLYEVSGIAWSGSGAITRVEVSADGGESWADADIHGPVHPRALTRFSLPWQWDGSPLQLQSRATDEIGHTQPTRSHWKTRYDPGAINHFNAIQAWDVTSGGYVKNAYS